ncbi:MAG: FAD binding domain-containing protein [Myxococcales bacterium]
MSFILNQRVVRTEERPGMVLLEFIRDVSCLSGTKEACREGECGACTVLVGKRASDGSVAYKAVASCLLPLGDVDGCHVVTVEGLAGKDLTLVQQLIVEKSASQCGFCTPGIVLSLTGFCLASPQLSYDEALDALDGNICRCTGYVAIRNAAKALAEKVASAPSGKKRLQAMVDLGVVPAWFGEIPAQLGKLRKASAKAGKDAVLVAGGTDLFVQKPDKLLESELCFLSRRKDLQYTRVDGEVLRIGGATTLEDFRRSEAVKQHFPQLEKDFLLHSSTILRNKATLAGNVVNASPIGDATIILLALDARLVLEAEEGKTREVPLSKFFLGYKKVDLACGELVKEIVVPLLPKNARYHFEKVSNRTILDIAAVNTAVRVTCAEDGTIAELKVSAGGVGPTPMLVPGTEAFHGRKPDAATADAIAKAAMEAARPIDDIRGSAAYKKALLGQLVRAHFLAPAAATTAEVSR